MDSLIDSNITVDPQISHFHAPITPQPFIWDKPTHIEVLWVILEPSSTQEPPFSEIFTNDK